MFGRSGQMFPRRTFHDAIYEEEYGSDNEDECCRCRGLSAILCWFLSVIILVGLAATVVLTVFFILRSRALVVKPDTDLDVEMYGKDQNLFEAGVAGATSKEAVGSNEINLNENGAGSGGPGKRKKGSGKGAGRGPPGSTKNDVDADVNEDQNAIADTTDEDQAENASINHQHDHPTIRHNRLQPYPSKGTSTTTETPAEASEEENNESSEEEETDTAQTNNEEGSHLNSFSGPRNPSYQTPSQDEEEEEDEEEENENDDEHGHGVISAESSSEYKSTRYQDGSPIQQVLFTESPKVTLTTPNPPFGRRFPTGRTSFSTTSTTVMPPPQEESEEEEEDEAVNHDNDEENSREDENNDHEKSSEERMGSVVTASPQTTTSVYDNNGGSEERESGMTSTSGESQLKQMLRDSIPPHGKNKDGDEESSEGGGVSGSSEFNLSQRTTTTSRPTVTAKTQKPIINRQDPRTRIISRNFTRGGTRTTTEETDSDVESATSMPTVTTMGPAGHRYDFTLTPNERTKLKQKSAESSDEMEVEITKAPPKSRYRSTTSRPSNFVATPEPPSTAAPRTRGTTQGPAVISDFGIKMGAKRGSVESPIDIIPSPDLSPKGQLKQNQGQPNSLEGVDVSASPEDSTKTSSEFLDVLVTGDLENNHKTLVTKKTEDGIVTSAILPPWYDSNGANSSISDVLATTGTTLSNAVAKVEIEGSGETATFGDRGIVISKKSSEEVPSNDKPKETGSEFERLVNMFSKQEASSEEAPPIPPRFGFKKQKPVVLKKPGGHLASRFIPAVPGRAGLYPAQVNNQEETKPEVEHVEEPEEMEGDDVGRTGALPTAADVEDAVASTGYYPENNNGEKIVEHHVVESQRLASDEMADSAEQVPSHVIDVESHGPNSAEVVIEQDSSPVEDEEGDFVEDDYGYGENPPTMSMSGSAPNQKVVPVPEDFIRGSGIRRPTSGEDNADDLEQSGNAPQENNITAPTTKEPARFPTSPPGLAIRRPAYTREEIAKSSGIPAPPPDTVTNNKLNEEVGPEPPISGEGASDEFEEYEEEYEGGSVEHSEPGSLEKWSSEKTGGDQRWSSPDKIRNVNPPQFGSVETTSAESVAHENVLPNSLDVEPPTPAGGTSVENSTGIFRPPSFVKFHENKMSFSTPHQAQGDYHSKDGWRPVLTGSSSATGNGAPVGPFSHEPSSTQEGSFEPEQVEPSGPPQLPSSPQQQSQVYDIPEQPPAISMVAPPQPQQWGQEGPGLLPPQLHPIQPSPMIPPPVPATVKFPDSEEDHEDRHHLGRNRLRQSQFDRSKYMLRPVPPPIVMRRHPHASGPFQQPLSLNRQGPPPPPPQQRPLPQIMPQASQISPQFVEPPPPPARMPLNRNFPLRPNPMRRFNFGGPPQAQPRSAGNIKWPMEESLSNGDLKNANHSNKVQNVESSQSEMLKNKRRRRRRRAVAA